MRKLSCLLVALSFTVGGAALAAPKKAKTAAAKTAKASGKVRYMKKQTITFGDDLVEAGVQKPDDLFINVTRKGHSSSLIKMRVSFLDQMVKSAENI